jgi:hypothetical protein
MVGVVVLLTVVVVLEILVVVDETVVVVELTEVVVEEIDVVLVVTLVVVCKKVESRNASQITARVVVQKVEASRRLNIPERTLPITPPMCVLNPWRVTLRTIHVTSGRKDCNIHVQETYRANTGGR